MIGLCCAWIALLVPLNMRDTALMAGETIFTMHHPNGAAKKTQVLTHSGGSPIYGFDFAGGSSGSAVFDIDGNLIFTNLFFFELQITVIMFRSPFFQMSAQSQFFWLCSQLKNTGQGSRQLPEHLIFCWWVLSDSWFSISGLKPAPNRSELEAGKRLNRARR